jgi:hypothetical protein
MDTLYLSARRPSSPYRNVNVQLQQWQNSNRLSEVSHVMPQNTFTQVTIAAYQRKNSCHGDFAITHHNSDTERQRGHLMRNSICDKNPRGKSLRARSYYSQAESINAIDQTQNSPPMLCSTSSYLFRPHQSEPYWTGSSFASQKHFPDDGGARFAPLGCPSPYVVGGFPPTPADTVHAEDFPPKNSSNNSESTIFSPRSKLETGSYEVAPGICAKNPGTAETAVEEQQGSENLLTPPPETTACSAGRNTKPAQTQIWMEMVELTSVYLLHPSWARTLILNSYPASGIRTTLIFWTTRMDSLLPSCRTKAQAGIRDTLSCRQHILHLLLIRVIRPT